MFVRTRGITHRPSTAIRPARRSARGIDEEDHDHEGNYEIAFGHHRIEAARQLGMTKVPIEVRELNDWKMVRMLASENATQRGSTAAACLDAVAAISKVLAYNLLRWDEARFGEISPNRQINYPECRGRLVKGSGIGHDCVRKFMPDNAYTDDEIRGALATLKDSGRMDSNSSYIGTKF